MRTCNGNSISPSPTVRSTATLDDSARTLADLRNRVNTDQKRAGWLALDVPLLELSEPALSRFTKPQRERICEPAFYDLLHRELSRRYLASD